MEELFITFPSSTSDFAYAWNIRTGAVVTKYNSGGVGRHGAVSQLGAHYFLCTVSNKSAVLSYSFHQESSQKRSLVPERMACIAASSDGSWIVGGGSSGSAYLWRAATGELVRQWDAHFKGVNSVRFSDDDIYVVTGGEDSLVHVWVLGDIVAPDTSPGAQSDSSFLSMSSHSLPITDLHCGLGGSSSFVFSSSKDRTLRMWELATGKIVFSAVFPAFLTCVTTDACERAVFVGGGDGVVYGVDLLSPQVSHAMERASTVHCSDRSFVGHTMAITSVRTSVDGTLLVSTSEDKTARVWDVATAQTLRVFSNHRSAVTASLPLVKRRTDMLLAPPSFGLQRINPLRKFGFVSAQAEEESKLTTVTTRDDLSRTASNLVEEEKRILEHIAPLTDTQIT